MALPSRHIWLSLCLLTVLFAGCRKQITASSFSLDNGLRIELLATPQGDRAALALLFDVGADHDPPGRSGMAHLVQYVMQAQLGGDWRGRTGADYTLQTVVAPTGRILDEIDAAALRMSHPLVTDSDLARERSRLVSDLAAQQEGDALAVAMFRAAEAVRPSRGGGLRGGVVKELTAITANDVDAFRRMHYGAATARLVIAGHIDVAETTRRVREGFASITPGAMPAARPPAASSVTGTLVMGDAPTAAALAVPAPAPKDPLYPAFLALAARLTGPAEAARPWKAEFDPLAGPDILFVTATLTPTPTQPAEPAAARMREQVKAVVAAPLAPDEPARVIERFGAALGLSPPTPDSLAAGPGEAVVAAARRAQLGIDGTALLKALGTIAPDQMTAAAALFDAKSSAAVVAGGK